MGFEGQALPENRLAKLSYDEAAAAQLQAAADTARVQVQRCKDHVDQLSSMLTSAQPSRLHAANANASI